MENYFRPPDPLVLDGNISENWKRFSQKFKLFTKATGLDEKDEEKQVACFLSLVGDDGLDLFNSFTFQPGKDKVLSEIVKKFEVHCAPQKNVIFERAKFNTIVQKEGQSFDSFLTELRKAVKTTEYPIQDEMIRDRIVIGLRDTADKEKLMREASLTLTKAINYCRAKETSKDQVKMLDNESRVDAIKASTSRSVMKKDSNKSCNKCGYKHKFENKCPATGKTCAKCQGRDHFAKVCRNKNQVKKKVHSLLQEEESGDETGSDYEFFVSSVDKIDQEKRSSKETMWTTEIQVNGKTVTFKLDTGAEVSTLPLDVLKKIAPDVSVRKTNITLMSYGDPNFKLRCVGEVVLSCKVKERKEKVSFVVVNAKNQMPLLGLQECLKLNLIRKVDSLSKKVLFKTLDDVVNNYSQVFEGLGKFQTQHHITLNQK